jgi:hypothetical protein
MGSKLGTYLGLMYFKAEELCPVWTEFRHVPDPTEDDHNLR